MIECTCNLCCYAREHPQLGAAPHVLCGCGRPVETPRRSYAIPTCYTCLPPPAPLPVATLSRSGSESRGATKEPR